MSAAIVFCVLCIIFALYVNSEEIFSINAQDSVTGYLVTSPIGIPEIEYQALYELYNSTNGPHWNWHDLANNSIPWQFATPANPCRETEKWEGIVCSSTGNFPNQEFTITHIDLVARNLSGSLPNTIDNLISLVRLALPQNHLNGTIPASLGNIPLLSHLDLAENELDGTIPENLGLLYNLSHFGLDSNQLTGTIPDIFSNMSEMNSVFLSHNNFVGTIPEFFAEMPHLVYLYLSHNMLHGPLLESLAHLSKLAYLDLDSNYFTGTIPQAFEKLTRLRFLGLQKNQLTGTIPNIFHDMDKLQFLYLNNENFHGTIPSQLGDLRKLIFLHLHYNRLTGTIPSSFGSLKKLEYLYLYNNRLTGTVPTSISTLPELSSLQVQSNDLSGSLESVFNSTAQHKLKVVQLSNNQFTGSLPSELFLLKHLVTLISISNCFRGTFPPSICNATNLETLILDALHAGSSCQNVLIPGISSAYGQSDTFYGQVPLCLFEVPTLNTLHLSGNSLSGTLPSDLQIQDRLLDMDLCHNLLHGSIPDNIQNRIWYNLDMSFNRFTGILVADFYTFHRNLTFEFRVAEFTLNFTELPSNIAIDLGNNRLSGDLPRILRNMQNISVLAGNLFGCKYDKSNLPQHDEGEKIYVCGSNAFDVPYYVWVALVGTLTIASCALWFCRSAVDKYVGFSATVALFRQWLAVLTPSPNESLDTAIRLRNVRYVASVLSMMEKLVSLCMVFVLVILLPIYIVLSIYYGTHTYQYAYTISGTFTSGVTAFVTFIVVLAALQLFFSACCSYLVRYLDQSLLNIIVVEEGEEAGDSNAGSAASRKVATRLEHISVRAAYFLINVVVVVGVNIAFVVVALYQSTVLLIFAQILLSLFKVFWNLVCSPILIRWTSNYLTTTSADDNKKSGNVFFALQLFVSLFNNIAIPCLVVAVVDPNCFYNLVVPAPPEDTNYLYAVCAVYGYQGCRQVIPQIAVSSYDPSFVYSYQCGSSFITYYAPTFVYVCFVAGFLSPLVQYAAMKVHQRAPRNRPLYRLLDSVLPPVWKPVIPLDSPVMVKRNIFKPFFDANLVMITMFTYAGVMLTFGAIFPPLGAALAVTAVVVSYLAKLKVGRLLTSVLAEDQWMYLDIIEAECKDVGTAVKLQEAVRMVVGFSCVFYMLFLFDALGDAMGFTGASWVLIVVPLTPPFVYAAYDAYVLATATAKGPVVEEEGRTTEMKRFSKQRGLRSEDGMTRSTVESRETALSDLKRLASESGRDTSERGNSDLDSVSNVLHNSM